MRSAARCYKFGGNVSYQELGQEVKRAFPDLIVQTVDSAVVTNEKLVEMIGEQTLEAGATGSPLARKPEVDLLMRLGATTQIAEAIKEVGARRGKEFVLIVLGEELEIRNLESGRGSGWMRLPRHRLVGEELQRIERAALLDAERA